MNILIIGANRGIGKALTELCTTHKNWQVIGTSRDFDPEFKRTENVWQVHCDITNQVSIKRMRQQLTTQFQEINWLVNCAGVLHTDKYMPEKALKHINEVQLLNNYQTNAMGHLLLIQQLEPLFTSSSAKLIASVSARIGSIEDNHLGGWYAYRMSKAALNMGIKTLAIEWARTHPQVKFMLLHPGTTDTDLSKPFQQRLPKGQLQTAEDTAHNLLNQIIKNQNHGSKYPLFIDYDGEEIPW